MALNYVTYGANCITVKTMQFNSSGTLVATDVTGNIDGSFRASFSSGCNNINVKFTVAANQSLSKYQVRITKANEDWDVDLGVRAVYLTNLAGGSSQSVDIAVNSTNFSKGDGAYRIALYAQRSLDYTWDVTYLFFVITEATKSSTTKAYEQFDPTGTDEGFEVISNKQI